jgi:subtilase family serine protease
MTTINKFFVSVMFVAGAVLIGSASVAHADTRANWFKGTPDQFQQMIQSKLSSISHLQHKNVCDISVDGSAACNAKVITDANGKASASAGGPASTALGPTQLLGAYNLSGISSSPHTIAIVDAYDDPNIASDLSAYDSYYNLPAFPTCSGSVTSDCFEKINENGSTSPLPAANSSWDLEISLDVEVAHATCQNCRIMLVEANTANFSDLMTAIDTAVANGATVVSGSWSTTEFSGEASYDSHFNKPGVAFTFAAGDGGYATSYPAASPYVTAVGGTTLLMNGNSYLSESTWSGSGSGCSLYEAKPTWQTDPGCATRTMNDVSADADPSTGAAVYDSVAYDGVSGWFQVGGTSLSTPIIASVYALQGVASGIQANSLPYIQGNASNLNDVTTGNDGTCSTAYFCTAEVGYDAPTGLGTPDGTSAFASAATVTPPPIPPAPAPTVNLSANPTSVSTNQPSTLTWSSTNATSCSASGAWSGTQSTSGSKVVTLTNTGTFTYTMTCTGAGGSASNSATVTVTAPPAQNQNFSLWAGNPTINIEQGNSGYDLISVTPTGGFNGSVTFSVSGGVPSGTSVSFNRNSNPTSSVLKISVGSRTPTGRYVLTVKGTSGSLTKTVNVTLNVTRR